MNRTAILKLICTVLAVLVVAATAATLTLGVAQGPTAVEAAGVGADRRAPTTIPVPSTTAPPATVPPTTVGPAPAPPTSTSTTTTAPPTTVPSGELTGTLRRGDRSAAVLALQRRLRDLGYWLGGVSDSFGPLTEQAVTAFQKIEGLTPDGVAGPATRAALAGAERPTTKASGDLVEVDKARQVLFVVRNGDVAWALNTSTGTELPYEVDGRKELADTPPGRWTVTWAVDGDDIGALGALYRPRYFHADGIAVHGYHSVPAYPASHGCVRVSEPAMDWIWAAGLMAVGSTVWVH